MPAALALAVLAAATPTAPALLARRLDHAASAAPHRGGSAAISAVTLPGRVAAVVVRRDATLADVAAAAPHAVSNLGHGAWLARRSIFVVDGATLTVAAPQVRELRLASGATGFANVIARDASLRFRGLRGRPLAVRSWDVAARAPDAVLADGRATVSVRRGGRLDISDADFSHLGFAEGRVSGVAVISPHGVPARGTGRVVRSTFRANRFGAYTYRARDMRWTDNRFLDNAVYGFDPHDASSRFVVARNLARGNGRHGVIFSRLCRRNVIDSNVAMGNGWHGIVIDDGKGQDGPSEGNTVVRNLVRDNGDVGISIDGSGHNVVSGNRVIGQRDGIRLTRAADGNVIEGNTIVAPAGSGIALVGGTRVARGNRVEANSIAGAAVGVRLQTTSGTLVRRNRIAGARAHAVMVYGRGASDTRLEGNTLQGRGASPVWIAHALDGDVRSSGTRVRWNYPLAHDLARAVAWGVGPALWLALFAAALGGRRVTGLFHGMNHDAAAVKRR